MELYNNNSDIFMCSICNYLVNDPYTCNNCESLNFCKECIDEIVKNREMSKMKCPLCQDKFHAKKNNSIFEILNKLKNITCTFCHNKFNNINDYYSHKPNCKNESNFNHHSEYLIDVVNDSDYEMSVLNINKEYSNNIDEHASILMDINKINYGMQKFCNNFNKSNNINPPLNEELIPRQCKLNKEYDLYYCGRSTNFKCNCSKKVCCPGCCLCPTCMDVNKEYHKLDSCYFINRIGYVSKKSSYKTFYCKRNYKIKENKNITINNKCDQLNPCDACKELNLLENYYNKNNNF